MELIVSDFMTNTCRVRPRPNISRFHALYHSFHAANLPVSHGDRNRTVTSSGSASEFYIEPLLSCINDVDIMWHRNDQLAVPEGHPVPQCLPAEFHREVEICELVKSKYPCYVFARSVYKLIKSTNSDNYTRVSTEPDSYAGTTGETTRHGPAAFIEAQSPASRCFNADQSGFSRRSMDVVGCIRCLVWPPQAAEWTTRRREYNWPDTATINCVVNNGCDVVQVAHPQCREDEVINRYQWRLSFSRAETVLLNTWSPKQQLVYHMLRVFITSIKNDIGESVIKRYFIKTVMLWMCERQSIMWDSSCVVNSCKQLLYELANWLLSAQFPMYFATECNLNNGIDVSGVAVAKLLDITDECISAWFVDNYICHFASQYPHIARSLNDIKVLDDLQRVLTTVNNLRQRSLIDFSFDDFDDIQYGIQRLLHGLSLGEPSISQFMEQINAIDSRFSDFIRAVYFLKAVSLFDNGHDTHLVSQGVVAALQSVDEFKLSTYLLSDNCTAECSWSAFITADNNAATESHADCRYFQRASYLMQTVRCSRNDKLTLLLKELTKMLLFDSMEHVCDGDSHTEAVRVYMACLYYSTGQYRTALEYCVTAITSVQSGNHVNNIERQLLPQFDDNIERVLGIILLYQFVHKSSLNQVQQAECNDVYSVDLLAHYLVALCLKQQHIHSKCSKNEYHNQYKKRFHESGNSFIADLLLFYFHQVGRKQTKKLHIYSRSHKCFTLLVAKRSTQFNANRLSRLLIQLSVEYLTSYRRVMSRDYSSVSTIVTRDYEAMYAYKCCLYEQCFELCDENVNCLLYNESRRTARAMRVETSGLFFFMDDDCLSLISFARLCGVFDIDPLKCEYLTQLTLSMYLLVQSKLRLRHSMTSLIDILHVIQRVHYRHSEREIINRASMALVYRKTVIHLKQRFGQTL